ncbi:TlpA family protein disulfide reductase [Candidatus Methylomicrobium oryzae]|jgi:thiol-disulfide isomerase/thioredoxin|uniref:TlpA family protein disulfide reductase n=1 Tax=Candidatus Methylomicrobium oryzae TaxID=2802053 RepID=UPI001920E141|nr:TlpA disulfide reductase family protein [Methylomicrobium sp. RS1]MBL1265604.1 TlpA family protein disulfide reductase [Methylomicrobium sp. RS1]
MLTIHQKKLALSGALSALLLSMPLSAAERGETAGNCALSMLDGSGSVALDKFKGKVVYLDFWASWCGPCAKSFPFMNRLHEELGGKDLAIIGVNLDENPEDAQAFLAQYPANFTIAADKGEQCARQFDVKAMPSTYLIGRDGVIRDVHLGFRADEGKALRETVEKLLNENPSAAAAQ